MLFRVFVIFQLSFEILTSGRVIKQFDYTLSGNLPQFHHFYIQQKNRKKRMGCQPSQSQCRKGPEIKLTIVDSGFMKSEHDQLRQQMLENNIKFQYFISLECFFDQFAKRYYNKVVTSVQNYAGLRKRLDAMGLMPNIYVILNGHTLAQTSYNTVALQSYGELVRYFREHGCPSIVPNTIVALNGPKTKIDVKILCKPGQRSSQQSILQSMLKKSQISHQFFNSYQLLEQSLLESTCRFIITDYLFHKQVVQLFRQTKSSVICYCSFDKGETYQPDLYYLSDNYLDIANDSKGELQAGQGGERNYVKCSKVYLWETGFSEGEVQEVREVLEMFGVQVRVFSNMEKVIKETTYFFCVTVVAVESQLKNLAMYFHKNDYEERVKLLGIPANSEPTPKGLFKLIRSIKKGYPTRKGITTSIDIIDKHYNSTKFEQIKKQLETNSIKCFGFSNLSQYVKTKKFISPFIISNFQQRTLLQKYLKQLQCKSKIIIFCNKNKITSQLKQNSNYSYVSSHFGKIITFVKRTHVFMPVIRHQDLVQFKEKIDKIRVKNKRISALKWSQIQPEGGAGVGEGQESFQFLNIAKDTNNGSVRDIQKAVATIWKVDSSILNLQKFKQQFIKSLTQLRKIHKISSSDLQFSQLVQKIKQISFTELLQKIKTFFDADNELGLEINKSLMRTQLLEKKEITYMREFLLLVFVNFLSGFQMPRIGVKRVTHWLSNPLIEKCEIGSYLFCKHFVIFYEDSQTKLDKIGKYKIELQLEYNTLAQPELPLNSFISYRDKIIFSPFSQFQLLQIVNAGQFKIVRLRYIKNVDFLKYIYQDNLVRPGESFGDVLQAMRDGEGGLVQGGLRGRFGSNLERIRAVQMFQRGDVLAAIEIHKRLIKQNEEKENLDSVLINQLNFELSCFYFKAQKNRQASESIKQLLESDPNPYIRSQCEKMISEVLQPDNKSSQTPKRRVSEQAMQTFVWLKNKEEEEKEKEMEMEKESGSSEENWGSGEEEMVIFDGKCMEVQDIVSEGALDIGKENIQA